jgi:uncharacterized membrane protein (DUF2068 family)
MADNAKKNAAAAPRKTAPTLYFIAGFKIFKGTLLLAAGIGLFALAKQNLPGLFESFLRWIHLDPENKFFAAISDWLADVTPRNVRIFASLPVLYGLFLLVGGTGLALRAKWAIWLAIGESAFFIPIEIYELIRRRAPEVEPHARAMFAHPKLGLLIVLAINVFIVWYLVENRSRLFRHHH